MTRWRQGDINIVVNADKEGFAHSFNITHGTSVCALALRVDDAAATIDRAIKLLDQPFRQAVGPGEMDIPVVRGLGGACFISSITRAARPIVGCRFRAGCGEWLRRAGLVCVDHLSQSMHYEEMLTWLLFYTSLLDVRKTPVQTVIDPGGVVQSQVVETPDGSLRLVLNASQSRQTLASRFLNELFGSGVQHIALGTKDIFETVKRLTSNGIELLPIPENYYDDLEARTDLSADEVERLRAGSILYDREGNAEYFQVYTRTLEGGFFEIVERRNYTGFGAVNAPIRLASRQGLSPSPTLPRR